MAGKSPVTGGGKPDLVAVILERSVAEKLALALAWALGSTGGGKSKGKSYPGGPKAPHVVGTPKLSSGRPKLSAGKPKTPVAAPSGKKSP